MKKFSLLIISLSLLLVGGGDGGGGGNNESDDASLSNFTLSGPSLDQIFQPNQNNYSASVNFLTTSVTLTARASDANATLSIDNVAVDSAATALNEGDNAINVVVTAEDGTTTEAYTWQ